MDCCQDPAQAASVIREGDRVIRVCRCGRRHILLDVKPIAVGVTFSAGESK